MNLQIRSLSGVLSDEEKKYLRKKLLWFEEHLPNSTTLTVGVRQHITKRSNQAIEMILHMIIPGAKKPVYVKLFKNNFNEAVDLGREKLERIVLKRKGRGFKFNLKVPRVNFFKKGER